MRFSIITLSHGGLHWVAEGIQTYLKRIRPLAKIEIINIPPSKSKDQFERLKKEDMVKIQAKIPNQSVVFLCDADGNQYSSESFASHLEKTFLTTPHIVFVIGPAYGLSTELLAQYPVISLSTMTFQHEMALLLLIEQIYRSLAILRNHPYHL